MAILYRNDYDFQRDGASVFRTRLAEEANGVASVAMGREVRGPSQREEAADRKLEHRREQA